MGFFVGFTDEIEKLALRLPSPSEMMGGIGATPSPPPVPVVTEPAAAPPQQNVHVHVHHQAKKTAPAAPADIPKPSTDIAKPSMQSSQLPEAPALPDKPPSFGVKPSPRTYASAGPTPGPHTAPKGISIGSPAPKGTALPSFMPPSNTGTKRGSGWQEDTGRTDSEGHNLGAVRGTAMTPRDLLAGISAGSQSGLTAAHGISNVSQEPRNDYSGFVPSKAPPASFSAGGTKLVGEEMPTPAAKPAKKKMFGTLASNE